MAALDTNILVRLLVQDDARQLAQVQKLVADNIRKASTLFVPLTVLLELEWVLRSSYGFDKETVMQTLAGLLAAAELSIAQESVVEVALFLYRKSKADFADCIHTALALDAGEDPLWTLDKTAAQLAGAELLT